MDIVSQNRAPALVSDVADLLWRVRVTLAVAVFSCAALAIPGLIELLQLDRGAVVDGQWWRLFTGHATHWNVDHLFWDVVMFIVLGGMIEQAYPKRYSAMLGLMGLGISIAVLLGSPSIEHYRGLSGIDSGLFVLVCGMLAKGEPSDTTIWRRMMAALLLIGFAAKIVYELVTHQTLFVANETAGFIPLPLAHLAGALCAAVLGRMLGPDWRWR